MIKYLDVQESIVDNLNFSLNFKEKIIYLYPTDKSFNKEKEIIDYLVENINYNIDNFDIQINQLNKIHYKIIMNSNLLTTTGRFGGATTLIINNKTLEYYNIDLALDDIKIHTSDYVPFNEIF